MIVADTNLLVYLFVHGNGTEGAESVLGKDPAWTAPWLWRSEFRSTLAGLVRRGDVLLEEAIRLTEEAERWMEGREYTVRSTEVLRLAQRSKCSAYDCEYVALALDLRVKLVTADQQVLRGFPTVAISIDRFTA